ncbi:MAG: T9SS type A sorting domain-containing protein, partial [Flavobacteriales bacterium]
QQSVNNQLLSYGCWPLSAKNLPPTEIRISPFPNPFDDELTFNSNVAVKNAVLIISDITGREMMQCGFTSGMKLQREAWPAGMYFYSVLGENGILASGKIIAN